MRTLIVGAGPIGSYFAARLTECGEDVTLYSLGPAFRSLAKDGIRLMAQGSDAPRTITVRCALAASSPGNWDLIIFAVKAQDLPGAAREFSHRSRDLIALLPQTVCRTGSFSALLKQRRVFLPLIQRYRRKFAKSRERVVGCVITKGLSFRADGTLAHS
ncbi:MAG: hypothetical protein CBARDMAM_6087 [uncultured Caballeronia sp.]|nr:MAG: hypothetical protein CBARDMAM_6087 [uncultured Caballeronia sp.]